MESERIIQEIGRSKYSICTCITARFSASTKPVIHQGARIALFTDGEGEMTINGKSYKVGKDTIIIILPWDTTFFSEVKKPLMAKILTFSFEMVVEFILSKNYANGLSGIVNEVAQNPVISLSKERFKKIDYIFKEIEDEVKESNIYCQYREKLLIDTYMTNKLIELMLLFCRYQQRNETIASKDNDVLTEIFKYIYSHISTGVSLAELSTNFYMSKSSISRLISEKTGMSFNDLVSEIRVSKTEELLTYTDLSLSDIAAIVGFFDAPHLIKVFNVHIGRSPKQYRAMYQSRGYIIKSRKRTLAFEVISHIDSHFMEDLDIDGVAELFSSTKKEINDSLGYVVEKSFDELLNYLRINKACEMLLKSDVAIVDIATQVGYHNQKTFSRIFRKFKNMSPGEFRSNTAFSNISLNGEN